MALPTIIAEVGFGSNATAASPTWTDISARVTELSVKRGRNTERDATETGVLTMTARNYDRALDPAFASSPYSPNVVPIVPVRLRATFSAVTYNLYRGDVEEWPQKWTARENLASIPCVDGFDSLNAADVNLSTVAEDTGTRIGHLLDAAEWPATLRTLDVGKTVVQAKEYESANVLSSIQEMATSEMGIFYIDAAGNAVFQNRYKRQSAPYTTVQVQLSNQPVSPELGYADAKVTMDRNKIFNDAVLTQEGGTTYTSTDTTSKSKYRKRTFTATIQTSDVNEIQSYADFTVQTYKNPLVRVDEVTLEPQLDDNLWQHALGREIGDLISVEVFPPGGGAAIVIQCVIESIQHDYTVGYWKTTWKLSRANLVTFWILGTSQLGTGTVLGF